ncbi:hypothetical protein CKW39_09675 [Kocuria sp. WRN011]|uniref:DUF2231 domain-containing protein n=1 Tax=Kocuria carniphila TaxID=262208 RepID=A0ABV3UXX1_9MICC|nr:MULTISPECIES: DUF2231 domain-containing protein [Kocuria]MCT1803409.1 hypothetical protein [Kocuria carniphila]PBB08086.1 hypothetical protein CKW39_09675 [Kocuria sp. WRN011]
MIKALQQLTDRIEQTNSLDSVIAFAKENAGPIMKQPMVSKVLSGDFLGHPLHPMLTDIPIGAWSMSALLDVLGGEELEDASAILVGVGVLSAIPTAATGLHDWQTTKGATSRVGFVHAATMDVTVLLYSGSLLARVTGHHTPGKLLGLAGLGVMTVGGFLGGHLTYSMGVNVEQEGPTLRAVK